MPFSIRAPTSNAFVPRPARWFFPGSVSGLRTATLTLFSSCFAKNMKPRLFPAASSRCLGISVSASAATPRPCAPAWNALARPSTPSPNNESAAGLTIFEQLERNRLPLGNISRVIDMQMVAAVVGGRQFGEVARVTHRFVEIDHSIKFTAAADPGVDLFSHAFFLRVVKPIIERVTKDGMLEGWNGCADDSDALAVSAR